MAQNWLLTNQRSMELYQNAKYPEAVTVADNALNIAANEYGTTSNQYLSSLSNKAYALSANGEYYKALKNFQQAAEISFELYTLPHVSHLETLGELGKIYAVLGKYDSAEYYLNMGGFLFTSMPEKNKPHYDTSSYAIKDAFIKINATKAILSHRKGQLGNAIQLLEQQLGWIKNLYPDNYKQLSDYQTTVNNLASYYGLAQKNEKAKNYALEYYRLVKAESHPLDFIYALQNLGGIYRNTEMYDSAFYYWRHTLDIIDSTNYTGSHIHASLLNNIGELYFQLEAYDSSMVYLKKSVAIQEQAEAVNPYFYQTTIFNLAESYHWQGNYQKADSIYNLLTAQLLNEIIHNFSYLSDNEKMAFYKNQEDLLESYKGFALEVSGLLPLQETEVPYVNKDIAGQLYDLQLTTKAIILNASKRMKNNILSSKDSRLIAVYNQWEQQKNMLSKALVEGSKTQVELEQLKASIEANEKWLTRNSRSFNTGFQYSKITWKQVQHALKPNEAAVEIIRFLGGLIYGALIVTPETGGQPVLSLVMSRRSKHLEKEFYRNYYNSITFQIEDTLSYPVYWQPIIDSIKMHMPGLKMPERIYLSNDGIYNKININSLYNSNEKRYVIDETEVVILTNTKELVAKHKTAGRNHKTAALFGRPQFSSYASPNELFKDLPGTGKEVALIDTTLQNANWTTKVYTYADATESNLKNLHLPDILHLASHGYFNPNQHKGESFAETMMQSGIALAGVNDPVKQQEDGLLTAFEVTNLNLDSTELVVLSACDTGQGSITAGEGVYGLQRALRVAGAKNMIMSLWKVDDQATQQLMVNFYKNLSAGNQLHTAFIKAQKQLREQYPQPYYWGAFVLAGK